MWRGQDIIATLSNKDLLESFIKNRYGTDTIPRLAYLHELKHRGEQALDAIGWPRHDAALYVNTHTGGLSRYADLFARYQDKDFWFFTVLDDWIPYSGEAIFHNRRDFEAAKPRKHQSIAQMSLF